MYTLLFGIFATHAGWYLVYPFLAIVFTSQMGLGPAQVGLVLAAQSLSMQATSLLGGWLADRLGRRGTMLLGLGLRAAGLSSLGLVGTLPLLLLGAGVAGGGVGLYGPAAKAGIAALASTDEVRTTAFSMRGIAANLGVTVGPVAGAMLLGRPVAELFLWAGAIHMLLFVVTLLGLHRDCEPGEEGCGARPAPAAAFLGDRPFVLFTLTSMVLWALLSQSALALPLHAQRILPEARAVGLLWTVNSLVIILLQVPISRTILARIHPALSMAAGALLLGLGLGAVGLSRSFVGLVAANLVFVLGEMFVLPTSDAVVSTMARRETLGSYFGVSAFAWGMGEGLGGVAGGALIARAGLASTPWLVYAALGIALAAAFAFQRIWAPSAAALQGRAPAPQGDSQPR